MDNKLFQTRIFFPSNTIPGIYDVNIYQIKNKIIVSEKLKNNMALKINLVGEFDGKGAKMGIRIPLTSDLNLNLEFTHDNVSL